MPAPKTFELFHFVGNRTNSQIYFALLNTAEKPQIKQMKLQLNLVK